MRISDWSSDVCSSDLLRAVDDLDTICALVADPDELRTDLLRLHGMAHALINGGAISTTSVDETIAELAVDIEAELDDMSALLLAIRQRIRPLLALIRDDGRSEECRVGQGWVSTGRVRWWPHPSKKKHKTFTRVSEIFS